MILENFCYNNDSDNFDGKFKRTTKNCEMETNNNEEENLREQQNLLFSPHHVVYKHLLSNPLFHNRSQIENNNNNNKRSEMERSGRQYFHGSNDGVKRKYGDEDVSSVSHHIYFILVP